MYLDMHENSIIKHSIFFEESMTDSSKVRNSFVEMFLSNYWLFYNYIFEKIECFIIDFGCIFRHVERLFY